MKKKKASRLTSKKQIKNSYNINQEPIVISKATFDLILDETEKPNECLSLYLFYYYTAKWQKTNQPKATTKYTSNGLKLSQEKVKKAKKELESIGLIENIRKTGKDGKVEGWYIKVNFIWTEDKLKDILKRIKNKSEKPPIKKSIGWKNHTVENPPTNALRVNILNALRVNKEIQNFGKLDKLFILTINKLPKKLQTKEIIYSIYEYFQFRKEIKNKIKTKIGVTKLVNKLKTFSEKEIINAIDNSIANGWAGVFPKKEYKKTNKTYYSSETHNDEFSQYEDEVLQ